MARKFKAVFSTENDTDYSADVQRTGLNPKYAPVEPGYYLATVKAVKDSTFRSKYRDPKTKEVIRNPEAEDGLWEYAKLEVELELHNDAHTTINQGFTVGIVRKDADGAEELIRPGGGDEGLIWGGEIGALFFLSALGFIRKTGEKTHELLPFESSAITNRVVSVHVDTAGYVKKVGNFNPTKLAEELKKVNGDESYKFDDVAGLVEAYNAANGYPLEDGTALKIKNYVTGFYPLRAPQVEAGGYFVDVETNAVYLSEEDYVNYTDAFSNQSDEPEGW